MMTWNKLKKTWLTKDTVLFVFLILLNISCTFVPRFSKAKVPSFSGDSLNSGFIGFTNLNVNRQHYGLIDKKASIKYNLLTAKYGFLFIPPVLPQEGLTEINSNLFLIDPEHLSDFIKMNQWYKSGKSTNQ